MGLWSTAAPHHAGKKFNAFEGVTKGRADALNLTKRTLGQTKRTLDSGGVSAELPET